MYDCVTGRIDSRLVVADINAIHSSRREESPGMIGEAEKLRPIRRGISTQALENRRAIMQSMRADMHGCLLPALQPTVMPDQRRVHGAPPGSIGVRCTSIRYMT